MIRAIVAVDDLLGISAPGHPPFNIPWHIPEDLQRFQRLTQGDIVIMGATTYEAMPDALPGRRNIVISKAPKRVRQGFECIDDLASFLHTIDGDVWIIGGGKLYATVLSFCDELYITHVRGNFNCDVFFPSYEQDFSLLSKSPMQQSAGLLFSYAIYKRKS